MTLWLREHEKVKTSLNLVGVDSCTELVESYLFYNGNWKILRNHFNKQFNESPFDSFVYRLNEMVYDPSFIWDKWCHPEGTLTETPETLYPEDYNVRKSIDMTVIFLLIFSTY